MSKVAEKILGKTSKEIFNMDYEDANEVAHAIRKERNLELLSILKQLKKLTRRLRK